MSFVDVIKRVSDVCPKFNRYALKDFVEENINTSQDFVALVYREGFKLVPADIEFVDYQILSPEERVRFELCPNPSKSSRAKVPLTVTHMRLVQYRHKFEGQFVYSRLYTPYMFNHMLHIKDKPSMVRKVILERTFSRISDKDKDGISVSPIRVNLKFNRRKLFNIQSFSSGQMYKHFIVTADMFSGKIKRKICEPTIVHYMLAKFGFMKTIKRFGFTKNDISFTDLVGDDTNKYEYFAGRPYDDKVEEGPGLFVKVKKTLFQDDQSLKFIVNLIYVMSFFKIQNIDNVHVEAGSIWKVILGIILFEDHAKPKAYSNLETHLNSADHFIDPITRDRFKMFGVQIEDTYDLLVHIFSNIDTFMVNQLVQDIYNSRIDVRNGLLVETYARKLFHNVYQLGKRSNIGLPDVKAALKVNPMMFKMFSAVKKDDAEHYMAPPDIVGDNFLFAGGLNKIRLGGRAKERLHPSMCVAESIGSFVGKYIGKTGYLNPFIPTDHNGAILHPEYAKAIDDIMSFLPK